MRHILIVDHQIKEMIGQAGQGRGQPCGEAVGIDGEAQSGLRRRGKPCEILSKPGFQQNGREGGEMLGRQGH